VWESLQPPSKEDPDLPEVAEGYKRYLAGRT
jgi:hypothetical protein